MTDKRIDQLRGIKWLTLKGSGVPLIVGYGLKQWIVIAAERYPDYIVMPICVLHAMDGGSVGIFAVDEERYFKSAEKLFANLDVLEKIYRDFEADEKNFYKATTQPYPDFIAAYDRMYSSGIMIDGFLVYSDTFLKEMKAKYPEKLVEIDLLTSPYGLHFVQKERLSLLNIALQVKESNISIAEREKLLVQHQQNFHWIQNNYKNAKGLPVSHFAEQLDILLSKTADELKAEHREIANHESEHRKQVERILADKIFAPEDYERLLWLGKFAWWMDRRKACNLIANFYIDQYAQQVAQERGLAYDDIMFLLPDELGQILAGEKTLTDYPTSERRQEMALIYTMTGGQIFIGPEAKEIKAIVDPEIRYEANEISGNIACRGKAQGIVRVVFDPHRQQIFNDGDILVAGMTRPDFLGLMKKAGAFVTDEGGVTCHAAIVAREMNKPCIIGTKIATKVLKDGMLVEVDADNGVVKILDK